MKSPDFVPMSRLDGRPQFDAVIRRDLKTPNRIYCAFPKYASLTPEEAINLANRLVDVLESERL